MNYPNRISIRTKNIFITLIFSCLMLGFTSCKKLIESIEPKSFVEKFYDQTLNYEWTVDEFRYTKYDEAKVEISDEWALSSDELIRSNEAIEGRGI